MTIESSREIERMFRQDSIEKKRIGSNVHRRKGKGSPFAGVAGGVRFAKNNFKKYEKNSKVDAYNVYEKVLPYRKFTSFDNEEQQDVMYEWILRYSKSKIASDMGIGEKRLNAILDEWGIDQVEEGSVEIEPEEIEVYKQDGIPSHLFKLLTDDIKFEIVDYFHKVRKMTNKEMAAMLDYRHNSFISRKSLWKKQYNNRKKDEVMSRDDNFLIAGVDEVKEEKKEVAKTVDNVEENPSITKKDDVKSSFSISIDDVYTKDQINSVLSSLQGMLVDGSNYRASITLTKED